MGKSISVTPDLHTLNSPSAQLGLQLVRVLTSAASTPHDLALLTLLFGHLEEEVGLRRLREQICPATEAFINGSPRDQPNQAGKVLLAACCLYTKISTPGFSQWRARKQFEEYITYAADHGWLDDAFLAFYCHHLSDVVPICGSAVDFFQNNYARFIERRNIEAIAQSMLVLGDRINAVEKAHGYQTLWENWQSSSIRDQAWILLAMMTSVDPGATHEMSTRLTEHLNERTAAYAAVLSTLDFLSLGGRKISESEIDEAVSPPNIPVTIIRDKDGYLVRLPFDEEAPLAFDLSTYILVLFALSKSGATEFVGVYEAQKDLLISIVEKVKSFEGRSAIGHFELALANLLTILATLGIGLGFFFFFTDAELYPPRLDISMSDLRNIDFWDGAFGTGLVLLLLAQLRALIAGRPAITYWLEIAPLRQLISLLTDVTTLIRSRSER